MGRRGVPRDHGNRARDKAGLDQKPLLTPQQSPVSWGGTDLGGSGWVGHLCVVRELLHERGRWDWAIAEFEVGVGVHNSAVSPVPLRVPSSTLPCCRSYMCCLTQPPGLCSWVWAEAGWSPAACYCHWKSRAGTLSWHLQPSTPRACWDSLVGPSSPSLVVHVYMEGSVCVCMYVLMYMSECVCTSICMFMQICIYAFPVCCYWWPYAIRGKGSSTFL